MPHAFASLKYAAMLLLAFALYAGCNRRPIVYKLPSSHIYACRNTPRDSCAPFLLERSSSSQIVKVIADNLVNTESLPDCNPNDEVKASDGATTIAYLVDTTTSRLYMDRKLVAKSLKPMRSSRAPLNHNISLDLTNIPDGEYVIIFSWCTSEWDSSCKMIIKTL